ncbi:MAG: Sec-independent protein translocase protein TatB [Pseudomonadota bacterium]
MLPSFGWTEMLMIAIVLIVVIGPKDAITMLRSVSKQIKSFRRIAGDMQRQFNDALEEADLGDMKDMAKEMRELDPRRQIRDTFKPLEDVGKDLSDEMYAGDEWEAPAATPAKNKVDGALDDAGAKMREAQANIKPKAIVSLDDAPPVKAPAKKPTAKKPTAKKPAAKEPVAKKPVAKKPVEKKPVAKKSTAASSANGAKKPAARKSPAPKKPAASKAKAPTTTAKRKTATRPKADAPTGDSA